MNKKKNYTSDVRYLLVVELVLEVKLLSSAGDMDKLLSYSSKRRSSYSATKGSSISSGGRAAEGRRTGIPEPMTSSSLNKSSKSLDSLMSFSKSTSSLESMEVGLAATAATGADDLTCELAFLTDV